MTLLCLLAAALNLAAAIALGVWLRRDRLRKARVKQEIAALALLADGRAHWDLASAFNPRKEVPRA